MQGSNAYLQHIYQPAHHELEERFREMLKRNTPNQTYDLCFQELESLALFWVQSGWDHIGVERYEMTPYLQKTMWSLLVKTLIEDLIELHRAAVEA